MNGEEKLMKFVIDNHVDAELIRFSDSVKTVQDAISVTGVEASDIIKTIIFKSKNSPVAAIVTADFRISRSLLKKAVGTEVEITSPEETLKLTGYPAGGVPCIGHDSKFVVDPKVFEKKVVYSGGGSDKALLKINTQELEKNTPIVAKIRK
ncbi:MAG: hypothetical protein GOU98_03400 [Candidatus Altiarchaeota archaeon]|nr:hypothetical protein [Candidatus Altiarchaeota archaeon]